MEKYSLAQWRKLRGMSQEQLAVMAGVSARSIINYEGSEKALSNASYKTVQALADCLGIKISQIFLGSVAEKQK